MTTARIEKLVDLLMQRTLDGTVRWETTGTLPAFRTTVSDYTVYIRAPRRLSDWYSLAIVDAHGTVVEEIDTAQFPQLRDLYGLARRHALEVPATIDALITRLETL